MSSFVSSATAASLSEAVTRIDPAVRAALASSTSSTAKANPSVGVRKSSEQNIPLSLSRMFPRLIPSALLIAGDIASFLISYFLLLPFLPTNWDTTLTARAFALAAAAAIVLYASSRLYPGYRLHHHEHLRRRTTASVKVAVLAAIGAVLLPVEERLLLVIFGFLGLGLIVQCVMHRISRDLCWKLGIWGERAVIIGTDNRIAALTAYFTDHWQYGIRPESPSSDTAGVSPGNGPTIALIADDTGSFISDLASMRRKFTEIILLSDTQNLKISGLRPTDTGGEIGIRLAVQVGASSSDLLRRFLDLVIAIPAALVFAPFILIAAAAIYAVDPGPVFFKHAREGLSGKTVHVLKLRTMYRDAEQRLQALLREDSAAEAEWSTHFKLHQDPRVLPIIGHLLRSTSFDELPQLVNIIAGDMAIVGPRPFPEYHLLAMDSAFRDKRRSVTPGLTGLWQISERSSADIKLQQQLDEFYIDNRSLWFDWHILLRTIPAVFMGKGAY